MRELHDDPVGVAPLRPTRVQRAKRLLFRLSADPFDLGQREDPAFVERGHRTLIDRWAVPMAFELAFVCVVLTVIGPATHSERLVGFGVAFGAFAYGVVMALWGRTLPVGALDFTMPFAGLLLAVAGIWGGDLKLAVPTLAVVAGTCIYAQRPWHIGFLMTIVLGIAYAVVLAVADDGPAPVSRWVIVMTAVVSSGAFVHWIRRKVLEFVEAEHEVRASSEHAAVELAEMSRAKTDFLSRMSHELRTPLNAVLGFTSILLDRKAGPLTDLQAEYLGDVNSAGLHLVDLVDDVLDVAQVEAGKSELDLAPFAVGPTIADCVRMVRERAARGGITVHTAVAPDLPVIEADGRKVRQALLNVVANAVRFTPAGGTIEISAWQDGGALHVAVLDTGVGIAVEDQERMFDRFEQAHGTPGGTGLGLPLARRFVEQHGGRLTVDSRLGEGATFTMSLPVRPPAEPVEQHHLVAARPAAAETNSELYEALTVRGSPANRAIVAQLGRTLSLGAAGLAIVLAVITPGAAVPRLIVMGIAAAALAVMVAMGPLTTTLNSVGMDLICLFGTVSISGVVYFSGSFADLTPLAYGWLICVAFAPWAGHHRILELLMVGVGYAVVLVLTAGPGSEVDMWIAIVGVFLINGLMIRALVSKLHLMMYEEREARRTAEAIEGELVAGTAHKDDFVASMSHELRTPLNAIIGFSEVVLAETAGPLNTDQKGYVEDVVAAGRQLLALIDDILELAKLDAGRVQLVAEVVDVTDLVERAVEHHHADAAFRAIDLRFERPVGPAPARVDTLLMEHAVSRLVARAVQATPDDGTVVVSVSVAGRGVHLRIVDQSPALPSDREHIFDSPHHWDERDGSGLSLALGRRIVDLHGGSFIVRPVAAGNACDVSLPTVAGTLVEAGR